MKLIVLNNALADKPRVDLTTRMLTQIAWQHNAPDIFAYSAISN